MLFVNGRSFFSKIKFIITIILLAVLTIKIYNCNITDTTNISKKNTNFNNSAVIVEFRSTSLLITAVLNVIENIPEHWPVQIFHCPSNSEFIRKSHLAEYIEKEKIILTELADYRDDFAKYTNSLLRNISFWKQVRAEKVLLFQIDSIMCSNSPHKITDYLQYDYIGAPWADREPRVGNGGFSWRSKNKTITLIQQASSYNSSSKFKFDMNEDVWYSMYMSTVGNVAPINVSKTFSVESMFYENPLGVHKMIIKGEELKKLCNACPEARLVPPYCR